MLVIGRHSFDRIVALGEFARELLHFPLGRTENDNARKGVLVLEQVLGEANFLVFMGQIHQLRHAFRGLGNGHGYFGGILEDFAGQVANLGRHGRGEHEALTLGWQDFDDAQDVVVEADVEHSVRFVQN